MSRGNSFLILFLLFSIVTTNLIGSIFSIKIPDETCRDGCKKNREIL